MLTQCLRLLIGDPLEKVEEQRFELVGVVEVAGMARVPVGREAAARCVRIPLCATALGRRKGALLVGPDRLPVTRLLEDVGFAAWNERQRLGALHASRVLAAVNNHGRK